jgi:hypothetical protein
MGRHEHRYWDGSQWTDNVADQGQMSMDPVQAAPQAVAAPAEPSRVDLPAIDPSQIRVTGAMPAITPQQQETPPSGAPAEPVAPVVPTPHPAPAVTPEPVPVAEPAAAAAPVAAAAPAADPLADTAVAPVQPDDSEWDRTPSPSVTGTGGRHPILAGLLSIAAPGSGHVYLGRRPQIGYALLAAFVIAIIVGWFINWPIGLIIYVAAAAFALFDLRAEVMPAAQDHERAMDNVDAALAWRIVGAGGVALIVGLILPWYRIAADVSFAGTSQSTSASANGFDAFGLLDILLLLLGLAAVAVAAIHITQSSNARSALPSWLPLALSVLAGIAWLFVLYRLLDIPGDAGAINNLDGVGGAKVDVTFGRGLGAWLDYAGALAVAAGAFAASRTGTSRD